MFRRPALPLFHPASLLATWFGSGLAAKAPGTFGSLAALPCGAALLWFGGPWLLLMGTVVVFLLGLWASGRYAEALGRGDPGEVVIDEVAGQWIALLPLCLNPLSIALAFVLFRVFDISKLWPVNLAERHFGGAWGIMLDDVVAGIYAAVLGYAFTLVFEGLRCSP